MLDEVPEWIISTMQHSNVAEMPEEPEHQPEDKLEGVINNQSDPFIPVVVELQDSNDVTNQNITLTGITTCDTSSSHNEQIPTGSNNKYLCCINSPSQRYET